MSSNTFHPSFVRTKVGAAYAYPGPVRRGKASHLGSVLRTAHHHIRGNHSVPDDTSLAVHVLQERVEGLEPLGQTLFEVVPVRAGHGPGHAVDGDDSLVSLFVSVDNKGNPLRGERAHDAILDIAKLFGGKLGQGLVYLPAVLPWGAVRQEHLVIYGRIEFVSVKVHGYNPSTRGVSIPECLSSTVP